MKKLVILAVLAGLWIGWVVTTLAIKAHEWTERVEMVVTGGTE
ncbi:hypothetical protein BTM_1129 [Burkholderia thailandensis 34]|nr:MULTISPECIES: hypothetical protein [Burkholderia]AJY29257.1 hypothetical protein BTM_1129 [Burkholderia thailandensis 34]CAG9232325.1 hypothetical protein BVI1335_830046 [Burkholderia vietnamiensis]